MSKQDRCPGRTLRLEALESRNLLAALTPTAYEQYMLELVNSARSDPAGTAASYGIDLNEGLAAGTISAAAKQPLAFNPYLIQSATTHSQWMLDTGTFSHIGKNNSTPGNRMTTAGYTFSGTYRWSENIAWSGTSGSIDVYAAVADLEEWLFVDADISGRGHRVSLLDGAMKEVGVCVLTGVFEGWNAVMIAQDFALSGSSVFLTGVVYNDDLVSANNFYTPGEGLGSITITATRQSDQAVYSTTTWSSGGYTLALPAGVYSVTASGAGLGGTCVRSNVTIGSQNVKVDFTPDDVALPVLSIADMSASEGNAGTKTLTFTVCLSGINSAGVSVNYATANGTATAGSDYATVGGTLTWAAGNTSAKTITVTVYGDTTVETDEVFYLNLSGVSGATVSDSQSIASLRNDDAAAFDACVFQGDFNGDGTNDILWENQATGVVGAWRIAGGAVAGWAGMGTVAPSVWKAIGVGDFDGDGTDDILWQNQDSGLVGAWIIQNGVMTSWAGLGTADTAAWAVLGVGDFNGDGVSDILWRNRLTGLVGAWLIEDKTFASWDGMDAASITTWRVVGLGDFNGDQTTDILWQNQATGATGAWLIQNGVFTHWAGMGTASPSDWQVVGVADLNGDRTDDVLWQNQSTGLVGAWMIQSGLFTSWAGIGAADRSTWQVAGTGSYNGDTTSDILWQNQSTGVVGAWIVQNGAFANWAGMGEADPTAWQILGVGQSNGTSGLEAASMGSFATSAPLTQSELGGIVEEAIARWANAGLDAVALAKMAQVQFAIDDLCGSLLGTTSGNRVTIDVNAAGNGWFIDSTPSDDSEYSAASDGTRQAVDAAAVDKIDLLTVVEHELGHLLGLDDLDAMVGGLAGDLMSGSLAAGIRKTPCEDHVAAAFAIV